jgi:hypothetical protein
MWSFSPPPPFPTATHPAVHKGAYSSDLSLHITLLDPHDQPIKCPGFSLLKNVS